MYIIQFPHPGVEAKPANEHDNTIGWNNEATHRRKFLKSKGKLVTLDNLGQEQEIEHGSLSFWGEWEAQSHITRLGVGMDGYLSNPRNPRFLNEPFLDISVADRAHNTDPYIFGNKFRYAVCRQRHCRNILPNLEAGSIILFGSSIGEQFRLDTVFVVSNNIKSFTRRDIEDENSTKFDRKTQYFHASLKPICGNTFNDNDEGNAAAANDLNTFRFRYYEGAMFPEREQYNGMYSFVPCKRIENAGNLNEYAFVQPIINIEGIIQPLQNQGINSTIVYGLEGSFSIWQEVKKQVTAQGLLLGTWFATPPFVGNNR